MRKLRIEGKRSVLREKEKREKERRDKCFTSIQCCTYLCSSISRFACFTYHSIPSVFTYIYIIATHKFNISCPISERSWKCYVKRVIRNVEYAFQTICYNARRLACIRITCTGDSSSNLDLYIYTITKQEKRKTENVMNSLCLIASIPYYKLENGKNTDFAWCIQCFHHNQAPPISKQVLWL